MILSVLCIYKHHTWTWYHWLGSIGSWGKVDFSSNSTYKCARHRGPAAPRDARPLKSRHGDVPSRRGRPSAYGSTRMSGPANWSVLKSTKVLAFVFFL